ncbi:outer membrane protein TolC [Dyadobacter jejuensis]|uniref:Outer membrane protein TolC n=1 Tax=Dyadobacter jejuensis TaxID=1082580 RepID=A0A316AP50_9BACT|nr:TolC family protein [Dyadobacter jejuensis]PWJ59342.1 outer membrane protein TolC [Dyadobacter jejuensis]
MKKMMYTIAVMAWGWNVQAQPDSLSLAGCYLKAEANYPLIAEQGLIASTAGYTIENARKGLLPQINLYGQASYQSEVTGFPISIPGVEIPTISKDQYKLYGEVTQVLYDGGAVVGQTKLAEAKAKQEQADIRTKLYQLRRSVNELYFGILLIDNCLLVNDLRRKDLQRGLEQVQGAIAEGAALRSHADVFRAELIQLEQNAMEQRTMRGAYLQMLAHYIGEELQEQVVLQTPPPVSFIAGQVTRPELDGIEATKDVIAAEGRLLLVKSRPKAQLFAQGGYGRPALNFLKNDFSFYGIGGLRVSWPIAAGYTLKGERQILRNKLASLEVQRELFLFRTHQSLLQQEGERSKWLSLLASDQELITLRESVKDVSASQLANGVKLPSDYVRDLNAEGVARENYQYHQIQFLLNGYNHQATLGQ